MSICKATDIFSNFPSESTSLLSRVSIPPVFKVLLQVRSLPWANRFFPYSFGWGNQTAQVPPGP